MNTCEPVFTDEDVIFDISLYFLYVNSIEWTLHLYLSISLSPRTHTCSPCVYKLQNIHFTTQFISVCRMTFVFRWIKIVCLALSYSIRSPHTVLVRFVTKTVVHVLYSVFISFHFIALIIIIFFCSIHLSLPTKQIIICSLRSNEMFIWIVNCSKKIRTTFFHRAQIRQCVFFYSIR